ncbi:V-type ATP synthase subunit F [Methanofollis fontis]|uniref:Vacuolar H+transporting two-sector ATPase F subunit n=1 Tax=Methanofollis fontis TaxID=2052832 RepID=A0A483CZM4_9EURY|nr:V-type ATP synthase subunit F [Methanofollis fontis]TAJ45579.1 hypothetical protein CUJ86_02315 [Methanofollis fontis]
MRIRAIGDRTMVRACRAGGVVECSVCAGPLETAAALEEALADPESGVVLVLDRFLHEIPYTPPSGPYPVVIAVPGPAGPKSGEDAVERAVRRVTGRGVPGVVQ